MLKEVSYKDLKFNPFRLIGDEWMLVTAGNEKDGCNTMTASWGGIGCLWGHNDPVATIYLRPSRYTNPPKWVIGTGTLIHSFGSMNLSLVI